MQRNEERLYLDSVTKGLGGHGRPQKQGVHGRAIQQKHLVLVPVQSFLSIQELVAG